VSHSFRADDPVKPEDNRFTKVVLTEGLDEPMEMALLNDGRVLFIERKGALRVYDPTTKTVRTLVTIPVNTKYTNRQGQVREAGEGLMGLVQDPNFDQNHFIYLYYADPAEKQHTLARYELRGDELVQSSKKVLLNVPTQREECCHTGGGMTFDKAGNLFLTVGNNTSDGYAPLDERPDQANWDDQRGAASTNDLRGKILRIHPKADGSYTIPEGNLFPKGTPNTKPEIYTMGHRNPWRISVDSKTGYLYWGEVGPDASDDSERGPRGYDEFNQAKGPGFFGWPYFIGNNIAYADYNFETKQVGPKFDPAHPVNDSPNSTGLRQLPPAQPAMIYYPYAASPEFPLVGASGRSATGGPVYHRADFPKAKRPFPTYYENKWLIVEFMRGWIMAVTLDEAGNLKSMERFLPNESFQSAIDMKFAPDGDLYVLEYGSAWFRGNDNARLVRLEYNAGNRRPVAVASASKTSGAVPLKVTLSADGSTDFDGDALTCTWTVAGKGQPARKFAQASPVVAFDKPGTYTATLTVTNAKGEKASRSVEVLAGNETPAVAFDVTKGNQSFFFPNQPIEYAVRVTDREDGSLANGKITPAQVAVTIDYLATYDPIELAPEPPGQRGHGPGFDRQAAHRRQRLQSLPHGGQKIGRAELPGRSQKVQRRRRSDRAVGEKSHRRGRRGVGRPRHECPPGALRGRRHGDGQLHFGHQRPARRREVVARERQLHHRRARRSGSDRGLRAPRRLHRLRRQNHPRPDRRERPVPAQRQREPRKSGRVERHRIVHHAGPLVLRQGRRGVPRLQGPRPDGHQPGGRGGDGHPARGGRGRHGGSTPRFAHRPAGGTNGGRGSA